MPAECREPNKYLDFVLGSLHTLTLKQTARLGGRADGTLFLAITKTGTRRWRSVGPRMGSTYENELVEAQPIEMEPYRADVRSWRMLDVLSDATGDPRHRAWAGDMALAYGEHGFDPRSGLAYLGAVAEFDVVGLKPCGVQHYGTPMFKPGGIGFLERLWAAAPAKTARMIKAAYYGLVTRPETMDFNRYCYYDFNDSARTPSLKFDSLHRAFAYTGAELIYDWAFLFARTGDAECLRWAQAMADKWSAVQNRSTGLMPHFFGADRSGEAEMPPTPFTHVGDCRTGYVHLMAAVELRKRPAGADLAAQVHDMGLCLLKGIGRHGYNASERIFPNWIQLDGREYTGYAFYAFRTQKDKDEAVKLDPILAEVAVYAGMGFYTGDPFGLCMSNSIPRTLAEGAELTGDAELADRCAEFIPEIMGSADRLQTGINEKGQWSYPESGNHIRMLLILARGTKRREFLDNARKLADMELRFLAAPPPPGVADWWRLNDRNGFLESLVRLQSALR